MRLSKRKRKAFGESIESLGVWHFSVLIRLSSPIPHWPFVIRSAVIQVAVQVNLLYATLKATRNSPCQWRAGPEDPIQMHLMPQTDFSHRPPPEWCVFLWLEYLSSSKKGPAMISWRTWMNLKCYSPSPWDRGYVVTCIWVSVHQTFALRQWDMISGKLGSFFSKNCITVISRHSGQTSLLSYASGPCPCYGIKTLFTLVLLRSGNSGGV